jgi:hypothetical protein
MVALGGRPASASERGAGDGRVDSQPGLQMLGHPPSDVADGVSPKFSG